MNSPRRAWVDARKNPADFSSPQPSGCASSSASDVWPRPPDRRILAGFGRCTPPEQAGASCSLRESGQLDDRRERLSHLLASDRAVELLHGDVAVTADGAGDEVVDAGET